MKKQDTSKKFSKPSNNTQLTNRDPRPQNKEFKLHLSAFCGRENDKYPYDRDSLIALLGTVPYDSISIPVFCSAKDYTGDEKTKGYRTVGYIKSFDPSSEYFTMVVFQYALESISAMEKDAELVVAPRVRANGNKASYIIAIDIVPGYGESETENSDSKVCKVNVTVESSAEA